MRTKLHVWLPTVLSAVALFVALGGHAAAARLIDGATIKKGTVSSRQLANDGILGSDVRDRTLRGVDVRDESLSGTDIADGTLTSFDLVDGGVGSKQLADGGVTASDLAPAGVTGVSLDAEGRVELDFPVIPAHTCINQLISIPAANIADGTLFDDVVIATPGAFFSLNFSFSVKVEGPTSPYIKMCNVGDTNVDPDAGGTGKSWRYVAIDLGS